jgi:4-hydroxy-3-methylbut-2-enyl diphosphate reductase
VAEREGCGFAVLVQRGSDVDLVRYADVERLGITAGASAPETLVDEVIDAFAERFDIAVSAHGAGRETIVFNLPRELRTAPTAA